MKNISSPEENFYSQCFATTPCLPDDTTTTDFLYGKRYFICDNSLKLNPPISKNLIVELGCGDAKKLLWLKHKHDFQNAVGVDLGFSDEQQIESSIFKSCNLNKRWPFDDATVDVLISMMLFEHLFDPFFCFKETARVLAVDGRAFINLPLVTSSKKDDGRSAKIPIPAASNGALRNFSYGSHYRPPVWSPQGAGN